MKPLIEFIKINVIRGVLVIVPLALAALIVMKVVAMLEHAVTPIVQMLPANLHFPRLIAAAILLLACFLTGLVARTRKGRGAGRLVERAILNYIPGYSAVRSFARSIGGAEGNEQFAPALAEIEDALVPAFVVEKHEDGRCTVFVPSAPTPGIGAIYIMAAARVHPLHNSLLKTVQCVSKWGAGSGELLKAMDAPKTEIPQP